MTFSVVRQDSEAKHVQPEFLNQARSFFRLTQACSFLAMMSGVLALMSWVYGRAMLRNPFSGYAGRNMEPHTGVLCLLLGAALFIQNQRNGRGGSSPSRLVRALCGITLILSILICLSHLFALDYGFISYQWMTFQMALSLTMISLGLLLLDWRLKAGHLPSQYLAIVTVMLPLLAFVIHVTATVHGSNQFEPLRNMSVPGALTVFALAMGLLAVRPQQGFMKIVSSEGLAGYVARRMLFPLLIAIPLVSLTIGSSVGTLLDPAIASSVFMMIIIALFTIMTWVAAETVHIAENKLRDSEEIFRQIFQKAPVGLAEFDPVTERFLRVNTAFSRMIGFTEEELRFMRRSEAGVPVIEGQDFSEQLFVRRDGTHSWLVWSLVKIAGDERRAGVHLLIAQDMTEHRAIEEEKRRNAEHLKLAVSASRIGFYDWDIQRNLVLLDPQMSRDWGVVAPVRTLEDIMTLIHPDDYARVKQEIEESIRTVRIYLVEYRVIRPVDGRIVYMEVRGEVQNDADGKPARLVGTCLNIDERKKSEQKLRESEAKFRTITDALPLVIWSSQADGYHDYFNRRWYEFTGVPEGSTDGVGWNGMFHPDDQERAWSSWSHCLKTGEPYEIEYRLRHQSGQYRWTLGRALPVRNDRGKIIRWMGSCTDIHDQKEALEVLAASEARMRAVLSALPVGVIISDLDGSIKTTNDAFRQICGGPKYKVLQHYHDYECYALDSGKRIEAGDWPLAKAIKSGKTTLNNIVKFKGFDGLEKIVSDSAAPVRIETGEIVGGIAVIQDITKEKQFEAELGQAKDEAERANRAKSQFLANMSHEIRSPMNSVLGFADLLMDPKLDHDERIMYASRIKASGTHLLHIIDDILDLSKVEAGHIKVEWRRFCVTDLIVECIQSMTVLAKRRGIELKLACDSAIPQWIESDSIRFRQILMNIVGNAIKFTEKGQVRVGLRFQDRSQRGPAYFLVDVEDSGIGIAFEHQKELFQPFKQTDASITRKFGGTGLGLHLSRRLAEVLGGDLRLIWSIPGQGSCFTMRVLAGSQPTNFVTSPDMQQPVQLTHTRTETSVGRRYKVLIVDDNADNQALMKAYLRKAGLSWDVASDGEKALALATQQPYDIILMDVMMPVMDGLEATRRLREAGYEKPIIALTAHAMKEEVEKSLAAGCDGHLSKPVDIKELLATMQRFVELSARSEQMMFH